MSRRMALLIVVACVVATPGCHDRATSRGITSGPEVDAPSREAERQVMVREQVEGRGIRDGRVLDAMRTVPRHRFTSEGFRRYAYADGPLPIGRGQTMSPPYVVAFMAEALQLRGAERVLAVGTGSGYAAAVLSRLAAEVYGIERDRELHERGIATIRELGYANLHLRCADGSRGWREKAPFDAIMLNRAAEKIPEPLWEQLAKGGRLIYPKVSADDDVQELVLVTKMPEGPREERLAPVQFAPMMRSP